MTTPALTPLEMVADTVMLCNELLWKCYETVDSDFQDLNEPLYNALMATRRALFVLENGDVTPTPAPSPRLKVAVAALKAEWVGREPLPKRVRVAKADSERWYSNKIGMEFDVETDYEGDSNRFYVKSSPGYIGCILKEDCESVT